MLLEDKHAVIYGGGGRSEGRLPVTRRVTTPSDIGNAAAFLASDRAGAVTAPAATLACGTVVDWRAPSPRCVAVPKSRTE